MFLASADVDMRRGEWVDPNAGRMLFADWVEEWRTTTVHLRPRRPTATNAIYASTSCPVSGRCACPTSPLEKRAAGCPSSLPRAPVRARSTAGSGCCAC